jgi:hypothetical protein
MSSISVLQAPGLGQAASVEPTHNGSSQAPSTPAAGVTAAAPVGAPQFPSPRVEIDPLLNQVIIEYRDGQNGAQEYQIPSKSQLLLYQGTQDQSAVKPPDGKSQAV